MSSTIDRRRPPGHRARRHADVVIDNPEDEHYVEHHSDIFYVRIAILLAVLTGLEVST